MSIRLYSIASQKPIIYIFTTLRTSYFIEFFGLEVLTVTTMKRAPSSGM
jgi:hypothetical protein